MTVSAKAITVTAAAKSKTYDLTAPPTRRSSDLALVGSDAFTGSLTRAAGETVGSYAITQGTLAAGSNYNLTFTGAELTITAKAIPLPSATLFRSYGDTDPALTYAVSPALVGSDAFTGSLTRATGENV